MIPFNKPYYSGKEISFITDVLSTGVLTGETSSLIRAEEFLEKRYGFPKVYLSNSCTMALEMAALLIDISSGDQVIMPAFTYVSTANAFALRDANIVFADSKDNDPGMDPDKIEALITDRTKAIIVVHYAGISADMDKIMEIASRHNLFVIEDAAQCIDSYYKDRPVGSTGHISCFSFHETKNIHCGEGGFMVVNDRTLIPRAEIIRNKGTNRTAFTKGEVNKYEWTDLGFSAIPSSITTSFLWPQLQDIEKVQNKRRSLWKTYYTNLKKLEDINIGIPQIPQYAKGNGHIFYLVCINNEQRDKLIAFLKNHGIQAVFHYQSLPESIYFKGRSKVPFPMAKKYSDCLVRLPLFYALTEKELEYICEYVLEFFNVN
ncbi:MAG: TDP-4-keto-6-deoxy-D-glucose transaminase [Bacteroidetes bacterium]|jgi:dTDP-4-amino-4,6-dideoxygalactose transaminase|nr:TDP-4-keto-6-deoxy-D-glucose transaminase [Bacteroidota bacterium]